MNENDKGMLLFLVSAIVIFDTASIWVLLKFNQHMFENILEVLRK